ncbi:MAG: PqqD family protein [Haloechinothrix sp.]
MPRPSQRDAPAVITPDGGLVVVAPGGTVLRGNHTAAALWTALHSGAGHDEAATVVACHYRVPVSIVREDLRHMLSTLRDAGIDHRRQP